MSKSNTTKPIVDQFIEIMESMKDRPMAETVEVLATKVLAKNGKPFGVPRARGYYRSLVECGRAPGKVERAVRAVKAPKPKAAKAPKVPKAPVERKDLLKAAAKRAGVHADSIAEVTGNDDPLNLASPEKLSFDDLKALL